MNVLVTGGAGFIGSHLVEQALRLGHRVAVIDNESTGMKQNVHPDAHYYKADICSPELFALFAREKPEIVVHLAAQSVVPASIRDPHLDASVNINGLINVLEAARKCGVRKVIYSSTAAVYGEPDSFPIREEQAGNLLSPYAVSKFAGEKYLAVYHHLYGLAYTVFRFANVYGPRQLPKSDGGVVAIFLELIRQNGVLTVNGDGEQTRDFIYVEDVAHGIIAAFNKADNSVLNLSTGQPTTINSLIAELEAVTCRKLARRYGPPRPGDIRHSYLANDKMVKQLGWSPRYSLHEGLRLTWDRTKE